MNKKVIMVHGWDGTPTENWFPWLKKKLKQKGILVKAPQLPDTNNPRIYSWIPALSKSVGESDENTFFVGHSLGCQAIARYLETLSNQAKVGGAVFVAGFFKRLTGLENDPSVQETDSHWLKSPIDFKKIKKRLPKSVAIFSDNDPWVPLDNQSDFKKKLGSKIIIVHNMGHFSASSSFENKVFELPIVLESLQKMINEN